MPDHLGLQQVARSPGTAARSPFTGICRIDYILWFTTITMRHKNELAVTYGQGKNMDYAFPAYCSNCGATFKSRIKQSLDGYATITLQGNTERCPYCKHIAHVQSGSFEVLNGILKGILRANIGKTSLEKAASIAKEAESSHISTADALRQMADVNKDLANAIRSNSSNIDWALMVAILTLLYSFWTDYRTDQDALKALTEERKQSELLDRIDKKFETTEKHSHSIKKSFDENTVKENRKERRRQKAREKKRLKGEK